MSLAVQSPPEEPVADEIVDDFTNDDVQEVVARSRIGSSPEVLLDTQATSSSFATLKTNSRLSSLVSDAEEDDVSRDDVTMLINDDTDDRAPFQMPVIENDYDYTKVQSARTERRFYYDDTTTIPKTKRR